MKFHMTVNDAAYIYSQRPTDHNLENLIKACKLLIISVARKFKGFYSLDELMAVGEWSVVRAARKYNPDNGIKFTSFVVPYINGDIKNYIRGNRDTIRIPNWYHEVLPRYEKLVNLYNNVHGRPPTNQEIIKGLSTNKKTFDESDLDNLIYVVNNPTSTVSLVVTTDDKDSSDATEWGASLSEAWATIDGSKWGRQCIIDEVELEEVMKHLRECNSAQQLSRRLDVDYDKARSILNAYKEYQLSI